MQMAAGGHGFPLGCTVQGVVLTGSVQTACAAGQVHLLRRKEETAEALLLLLYVFLT